VIPQVTLLLAEKIPTVAEPVGERDEPIGQSYVQPYMWAWLFQLIGADAVNGVDDRKLHFSRDFSLRIRDRKGEFFSL
jgi:hypothetical protein